MSPLNGHQLQKFYNRNIRRGVRKAPTAPRGQKPRVLFVGGQPGAGKTTMQNAAIARAGMENAYVLDHDELLEKHPHYERGSLENDFTASGRYSGDVSTWRQMAINDLQSRRADVVIPFPMATQYDVDTMKSFQAQGYQVEIAYAAVNGAQSQLGIMERFNDGRLNDGYGRWIDGSTHDSMYKDVPIAAEQIERQGAADAIHVYRRGESEPLYSNVREDGVWRDPIGSSRQAIENERDRPWTQQEVDHFQRGRNELVRQAWEPHQAPNHNGAMPQLMATDYGRGLVDKMDAMAAPKLAEHQAQLDAQRLAEQQAAQEAAQEAARQQTQVRQPEVQQGDPQQRQVQEPEARQPEVQQPDAQRDAQQRDAQQRDARQPEVQQGDPQQRQVQEPEARQPEVQHERSEIDRRLNPDEADLEGPELDDEAAGSSQQQGDGSQQQTAPPAAEARRRDDPSQQREDYVGRHREQNDYVGRHREQNDYVGRHREQNDRGQGERAGQQGADRQPGQQPGDRAAQQHTGQQTRGSGPRRDGPQGQSPQGPQTGRHPGREMPGRAADQSGRPAGQQHEGRQLPGDQRPGPQEPRQQQGNPRPAGQRQPSPKQQAGKALRNVGDRLQGADKLVTGAVAQGDQPGQAPSQNAPSWQDLARRLQGGQASPRNIRAPESASRAEPHSGSHTAGQYHQRNQSYGRGRDEQDTGRSRG